MGVTKRLCGNYKMFPSDAPATLQKFRSQSNSTTIKFVSDYGDHEGDVLKGFKAHYIIKGIVNAYKVWIKRLNMRFLQKSVIKL